MLREAPALRLPPLITLAAPFKRRPPEARVRISELELRAILETAVILRELIVRVVTPVVPAAMVTLWVPPATMSVPEYVG